MIGCSFTALKWFDFNSCLAIRELKPLAERAYELRNVLVNCGAFELRRDTGKDMYVEKTNKQTHAHNTTQFVDARMSDSHFYPAAYDGVVVIAVISGPAILVFEGS